MPVLGVLPFVRDLGISDEDSVNLDERADRREPHRPEALQVVVDPPAPPEQPGRLRRPGGRARRAAAVRGTARADRRAPTWWCCPGRRPRWAICCGCASAGSRRRCRPGRSGANRCWASAAAARCWGSSCATPAWSSPSCPRCPGWGCCRIATHFQPEKTTARVQVRVVTPSFLTDGQPLETALAGYEIHAGEVTLLAGARALGRIERATARPPRWPTARWTAASPARWSTACSRTPSCAGGCSLICAGGAGLDRRRRARRPNHRQRTRSLRPLGGRGGAAPGLAARPGARRISVTGADRDAHRLSAGQRDRAGGRAGRRGSAGRALARVRSPDWVRRLPVLSRPTFDIERVERRHRPARAREAARRRSRFTRWTRPPWPRWRPTW